MLELLHAYSFHEHDARISSRLASLYSREPLILIKSVRLVRIDRALVVIARDKPCLVSNCRMEFVQKSVQIPSVSGEISALDLEVHGTKRRARWAGRGRMHWLEWHWKWLAVACEAAGAMAVVE